MFAVFKNGGKQYRACENQILRLERLEAAVGEEIEVSEVMLLENDKSKISVGAPYVAGASIKLQVIGHDQDEKVIIFKKRRRKNYRRKTGHRQPNSLVKIISITTGK
ncbi:MAG: 50S ribosomal protein L21 [Pseudomonadota bacterium]